MSAAVTGARAALALGAVRTILGATPGLDVNEQLPPERTGLGLQAFSLGGPPLDS